MDNSSVIHFGYQLHHQVIITAQGQTHSEEDTVWLNVDIGVSAGKFGGVTSDYADLDAFAFFNRQLKSLYQTLQGKAFFETVDGKFRVELKGDGIGHIAAKFDIRDDGIHLKFAADLDQTFLPELMNEVQRLIATYTKE